MSKMKDYLITQTNDFEQLVETSMQWDEAWIARGKETGRFGRAVLSTEHTYIYWFKDYAHYMLARAILRELDVAYTPLFDEAVGQVALTTTFETFAWL